MKNMTLVGADRNNLSFFSVLLHLYHFKLCNAIHSVSGLNNVLYFKN